MIIIRLFLGFLSLILISQNASAQQAIVGLDIRYQDAVMARALNYSTPLNEFGEQYSLYTGQVSLNHVDVSLPGNNELAVEFRRYVSLTTPSVFISGFPHGTFDPGSWLGKWFFALPRIEASYDRRVGWSTSDPLRPKKNCSISGNETIKPNVGLPKWGVPAGYIFGLENALGPHRFWSSPTIVWPDGNGDVLLKVNNPVPRPTGNDIYHWVTTGRSYVSCLDSLKNSASTGDEAIFGDGEGYLVRRPDGTKYWFDWMALEHTMPLYSSVVVHGPSGVVVPTVEMSQAKLALYVTRVEDRFGNWVTYSYSNKANERVKLDSIVASDGRAISVAYTAEGGLTSVHAGGRTWTYLKNADGLAEVVNPDGSSWKFSGATRRLLSFPYSSGSGRCENMSWASHINPDRTMENSTDFSGYSVTNPAGGKATFLIDGVMLGRSGVAKNCGFSGYRQDGAGVLHPMTPIGDYSLALLAKKVEGPGLPTSVWRYHYQSDIQFNTYTTGRTEVKMREPSGTIRKYSFGNRAWLDEGLLLEEMVMSGTTELQRTNYEYVLTDGDAAFSRQLGYHPLPELAGISGILIRPLRAKTIIQGNMYFKWEVPRECGGKSCFDLLSRPTRVVKSSGVLP